MNAKLFHLLLGTVTHLATLQTPSIKCQNALMTMPHVRCLGGSEIVEL